MHRYLLLIFVLFSSVANAQLLQITGLVWGDQGKGCGNVGDVKTLSSFKGCSWSYNGYSRKVKAAGFGGGKVKLFFTNGSTADVFLAKGVSGCPTGQAIGDAGVCEKSCPVGHELDELGQCQPIVEDPFCDSSEFTDMLVKENEACAAKYPNHLTDFSHSCTDRDNYSFSCNQGVPKPTDPNTGGDNGGNSGGNSGGDNSGGNGSGGDNNAGDTDKGNADVIAKLDELKLDSNSRLDKLDQTLLSQTTKFDDLLTKADDTKTEIANASATADQNAKDQIEATKQVKQSVDGLASNIDGVTNSVNAVGNRIENLTNTLTTVDTSEIGKGGCWETDSCMRLYQPAYENGIGGILMKHYEQLKHQVTTGMMDKFNTLDISNASKPSYVIDLNFGAFGNYGRHDIFQVAGLGNIFLFIRIVLMASTILYARSLVFGG